MSLYKGDTLRGYVKINGMTEFEMRETFLTHVLEAVNKLWTAETIETDW